MSARHIAEVETRHYPHPMPTLPSNIVPDLAEKPERRKRAFGLVTTLILVSVAFVFGGGVGGGIGGALLATENSKPRVVTSTTVVMPTATVISPPITTTVIQDAALCPLIHGTLYNSTAQGKQFLRVCEKNFLTPDGGQSIDIKNETISAFGPCLDFCANTTGCVAASWVMFSASDPIQNSVCFLKSSLGTQTTASNIGQVASGYLQP